MNSYLQINLIYYVRSILFTKPMPFPITTFRLF